MTGLLDHFDIFTPLVLKCRVTFYYALLFIMRHLLTKEAMNVA